MTIRFSNTRQYVAKRSNFLLRAQIVRRFLLERPVSVPYVPPLSTFARVKRTRKSKLRRRQRTHLMQLHEEMDDVYFRRTYRMTRQQFYALLELLKPHMESSKKSRKGVTKRAPNGVISDDIRLAAALRFFAGGTAHDICASLGIGHSSFYERCVWIVVDAINRCPDLQIKYPEEHEEQKRIALQFQKKSKVGFAVCAGCIDGMLVWVERHRKSDCGDRSFFFERKHKFGLNLQGICDSEGRFLEVWITHQGASSDFISFLRSDFYRRLTTDGFLASDLALFGDNAYVNTDTMITPFQEVSGGPKEDFNFFHSELHRTIACAFGMLVRRWSILRSPLSTTMGLEKQIALTTALCKLHNYCMKPPSPSVAGGDNPPTSTRTDMDSLSDNPNLIAILERGAVEVGSDLRPRELLNGGHHFDDVEQSDLNLLQGRNSRKRGQLMAQVRATGLHRARVGDAHDH